MPSWQAIRKEIPNPLTWESTLNAKNGLSVVLAINRRVFVKNSSRQEQCLPQGTVIAGFFKGGFWRHRAGGAAAASQQKKKAKKDEEEITEVTDADVLYSLQDADSKVSLNGKVMSVGAVVAEKRKAQPDAGVQYHKLKDQPKPGNPAWFALENLADIYFRAENIPVKSPVEGETPKIPCSTLRAAWRPAIGTLLLHNAFGLWNGAPRFQRDWAQCGQWSWPRCLCRSHPSPQLSWRPSQPQSLARRLDLTRAFWPASDSP